MKQNPSLVCDNTTDANYRQWTNALSSAFTAVGLTKTTDTGQAVFDGTQTHTTATTASTVPNWEIRQFTDSLQATSPFFLKIWYGCSAATNSSPALFIQVGTGTDGAGNLTGTVSNIFESGTGTNYTTLIPCYVSGDGGRINVALYPGNVANSGCGFYVERLKDDNGNPIGDGVNFVSFSTAYAGGKQQQFVPKAGTGPVYPSSPMNNFVCQMPFTGTGAYGNNLGVFPVCPNRGFTDNPDLGGLAYFQSDLPVGGIIIPITLYGVLHNYILISNINNAGGNNGNNNIVCLAMRYE